MACFAFSSYSDQVPGPKFPSYVRLSLNILLLDSTSEGKLDYHLLHRIGVRPWTGIPFTSRVFLKARAQ